MASLVLSECNIRPNPQLFTRPGPGFICSKNKNPSKIQSFQLKPKALGLKYPSVSFTNGVCRKWVLKVSSPLKVSYLDANERVERVEFDPGAVPPFKLTDIRAAIPKHCWVKDPWRSMSYVVRDVALVLGLAAVAGCLNSWVVWPLYWAAQSTMFWALFVLGHDW